MLEVFSKNLPNKLLCLRMNIILLLLDYYIKHIYPRYTKTFYLTMHTVYYNIAASDPRSCGMVPITHQFSIELEVTALLFRTAMRIIAVDNYEQHTPGL